MLMSLIYNLSIITRKNLHFSSWFITLFTLSQVDAGVELPPPIVTTNEQTQLDAMNADLKTFEEEEMLLKDGVYMTQPVYSERKVNSVEANQFNSNIGSSLPEHGVYTAQPVYSERRVNLVKANNLNGHIG
ncbi:hypothetical protein Gogos_000077, partial [Gossypium gossypioides]|nr:hypothetical protein [Gossypium gossypioides]